MKSPDSIKAYGLVDAPYLWFCALQEELLRLGFETCPFDPCVYILREKEHGKSTNRIAGILGVHVDDGIGGVMTISNNR